jgi:hypothetical protein
MFPIFVVIITLAVLYWFPLRRWFARWGTTPDELVRVMSGDRFILNPTHSATHAVTIDAPPENIWPWLVQMGYQRGGLYSYDWLDRLVGILDRSSANRILPEFQHLAIGDRIFLGPNEKEKLTVADFDAPRALVLSYNEHGFEWIWQFGLYPLDKNRTRLVSRGTERFSKSVGAWVFMRVMEPGIYHDAANVAGRETARGSADASPPTCGCMIF